MGSITQCNLPLYAGVTVIWTKTWIKRTTDKALTVNRGLLLTVCLLCNGHVSNFIVGPTHRICTKEQNSNYYKEKDIGRCKFHNRNSNHNKNIIDVKNQAWITTNNVQAWTMNN